MSEDGGGGGNDGDQSSKPELEQRVENLEEQNRQLAAQLARYLPDGPSRRDVLKYGATAFAAAGLGSGVTGAAMAQADENDNVGDVGTPSNPVDVFGDGISANSVSTDQIGNEFLVKPGDDLQNRLDTDSSTTDVREFDVFRCSPGATYGESNSITIPENTVLQLNGATIEPHANHSAIILEHPRSFVVGPGQVIVDNSADPYSVPAVHVDTSTGNFPNSISENNRNLVGILGAPLRISARINNGADALRLTSDGSISGFGGIGTGPMFNIQTRNASYHVTIETNNGGFFNGPIINGQLGNPVDEKHVRHINTEGSSGQGATEIRGTIQMDNNSTHGIHNTTSEGLSIIFTGVVWDTNAPTTASIAGPGIRLNTPNPISNFSLGDRSIINNMAEEASGGAPTAANYPKGTVVEDTNNPGDLYILAADGTFEQIST